MTLHFTSGTNTAANASAYQVTGGEWTSGTIQWSNKPAANVLLHSNIGIAKMLMGNGRINAENKGDERR